MDRIPIWDIQANTYTFSISTTTACEPVPNFTHIVYSDPNITVYVDQNLNHTYIQNLFESANNTNSLKMNMRKEQLPSHHHQSCSKEKNTVPKRNQNKSK